MTCYPDFSSHCHPHHKCSNTPQNKTSHCNIMHEYIFSLIAKVVLSRRRSFLIIFSVFCLDIPSWTEARAAGASYMKLHQGHPHLLWEIMVYPLHLFGIFVFESSIKYTRQVTVHSYLTDASSVGRLYFTIILKLAYHCAKRSFSGIIDFHFEQTSRMVSIRYIILT